MKSCTKVSMAPIWGTSGSKVSFTSPNNQQNPIHHDTNLTTLILIYYFEKINSYRLPHIDLYLQ